MCTYTLHGMLKMWHTETNRLRKAMNYEHKINF